MNKRTLIIFAAIALAGALFVGLTSRKESTAPSGETATVIMSDGKFEPEIITVKKGTRVIFKNLDSKPRWPASNIHPTHGIYPEFDPRQPVAAGEEWSFVFDKAGTWKYHDHLSPNLRGVISVTE